MCFIKTKESKLLIAKRDIIVYKVGVYADVQMFTPYFMTDYCYRRKALANQTVTFNKNYINIGLHSVLSLEGCYASLIGCIRFFSYCLPYNEETAKLVGTTNNVGVRHDGR